MSAQGDYRARLRNAARANEAAAGFLRAAIIVDDFESLRRLAGAALTALVPEAPAEIGKIEERVTARPAMASKLRTPAAIPVRNDAPEMAHAEPKPNHAASDAAIALAIDTVEFPEPPAGGNPLAGLFD